MSDAEPFTDAEVGELNDLLRAMNDTHRAELGEFLRFRERIGGPAGHVAHPDKTPHNQYLLVLLRKIRARIADDDGGGGADLHLDFDGVCDRDIGEIPPEEEWGDDYDDVFDVLLDRCAAKNERIFLAEQFWRRINPTVWERCKGLLTLGLTYPSRQKRVLHGLGHMVHSMPPEVNLVSVQISRNLITCGDIKTACDAFKGLENLAELDLSYNHIQGAGGAELFSNLLCHPSCRLRKLNLEGNPLWSSGDQKDHPFEVFNFEGNHLGSGDQKDDPVAAVLVMTLRDANRSLAELNLRRTGVGLRPSIIDIFIPFPGENWDPFRFAENRNHCLKVLELDDIITDDTQYEQIAMLERKLQEMLRWNAAGPGPALATKIEWYFDKDVLRTFYGNTREHMARCLALIGGHGNLRTQMKAVRIFQAQGLLFD